MKNNKVAIITGGSSGIGLATARELAARGMDIYLIARSEDRLNAAANELRAAHPDNSQLIETISADVSDRFKITEAIERIGKKHGQIDLLICNAGLPAAGYFPDTSVDEIENVLKVNYLGAVYCTKAAWPFLEKADGLGQIGLVSSVAGYTGFIGYSAYSPPKFALTGFAECLRMEGKRAGIRTTVLFPPDTDTPMHEYEKAHSVPEALAVAGSGGLMSAAEVARKFVRGLERGTFEVTLNFEGRMIQVLKGVWPRLYYFISDRIAFAKR